MRAAPGETTIMFESHFGLRQRPFRAIPDTDSYYPATGHEQAIAQMQSAINHDEGAAVLTAEPGMGKTLTGNCLLDRLGESVTTGFLTQGIYADRAALLRAILVDIGGAGDKVGEQDIRQALTEMLLKNYEDTRRTVIVIDEAQYLTIDQIEELRLLGNLEGKQGKAFQVVFLGLPGTLETLTHPRLASFNQRLAVRLQLEPLGLHESADYLVHQIRVAGGKPEAIVSDEALELIAGACRGIPRLLNRAGCQGLSLAVSSGAEMLDAEVALEALSLFGLGDPDATGADEEGDSTDEADLARELRPTVEVSPKLAQPDIATRQAENVMADHGRPRRLFSAPKRPA